MQERQKGRDKMTKTEAQAAMEAHTQVEGGEGEDHDVGQIVSLQDDETAIVSWESGVRTPCPISILSPA
jgi:hypothetical protein